MSVLTTKDCARSPHSVYGARVHITPELRLIADCCRRNFGGGSPALVALDPGLDWTRFVRLARFHRVEGLVRNALGAVLGGLPETAREALTSDAAAIAAANLRSAAECRRMLEAFTGAGLNLLFIKGLTLGVLAYGNAMTKAAVDIDLVVSGDQLEVAASQLAELGYELVLPGSAVVLAEWHRRHKESVWRHGDSDFQLDLHTRLADNPRLIPSIGMSSPRQLVAVAGGIQLPTVADDELLAYLAVHGASSAWFRVKWISDFAALLAPLTAADLDRRYARSQQLGAGRAAAQALLLADELFGSLADAPALRQYLLRDRANRRLCKAALRQLAGRAEPVEPTSRPWRTLTIHWTQFLLLDGAGFKLSELWRQARSALG